MAIAWRTASARRSGTCCCSKHLSMMKGRLSRTSGGQILSMKGSTSLRPLCKALHKGWKRSSVLLFARMADLLIDLSAAKCQVPPVYKHAFSLLWPLRSISSAIRKCLGSVCQRPCGEQHERPKSLAELENSKVAWCWMRPLRFDGRLSANTEFCRSGGRRNDGRTRLQQRSLRTERAYGRTAQRLKTNFCAM